LDETAFQTTDLHYQSLSVLFTASYNLIMGAGGGGHLLVVIEDFDDARDLYCDLFRAYGFEVHAAADGLTGLALVRAVRPQLILLDMALPGLDGFGVLTQIRQDVDAHFALTPVLVISAQDDHASVKRAFALGANAILPKPHLPDQLLKMAYALLHPFP
jgi:CheY-like chemotaxis protein